MRRARAFTLVEVVLALGLIALVAGITLGMLVELGARETRVGRHADRLSQAADLFAAIERALGGSMVAGADGGAGIAGGADEFRVLHRGVAPAGEHAMLDSIVLAVRWDATTGEVVCEHTLGGGALSDEETLAAGVEYFSVRYYSGARWRRGFDSAEAGELPTAVEVAVWFGDPLPSDAVAPALSDAPEEASPPGFEEMFADEFEGILDAEVPDSAALAPPPTRAPDRVRVFAVPDAPRGSPEGGA